MEFRRKYGADASQITAATPAPRIDRQAWSWSCPALEPGGNHGSRWLWVPRLRDPAAYKRDLGAYISPRDLTQLFVKAIDAPDIANEHGVPWLVVYGISNNTRAFWSLASARAALGYVPENDSEVTFARDIRGFLLGDAAGGRVGA
jgi:hypothetical protein